MEQARHKHSCLLAPIDWREIRRGFFRRWSSGLPCEYRSCWLAADRSSAGKVAVISRSINERVCAGNSISEWRLIQRLESFSDMLSVDTSLAKEENFPRKGRHCFKTGELTELSLIFLGREIRILYTATDLQAKTGSDQPGVLLERKHSGRVERGEFGHRKMKPKIIRGEQ